MEKHNPIFSLKNFRSFGEEGADFELAPITVLTGCNSAGKSSLVKALMLLSTQSTPKDGSRYVATGSHYCNFIEQTVRLQPANTLKTISNALKLGKFESVINEQTGGELVSMSYKIWSNYLQEWVVCRRDYCKKGGVLGEGRLKMFSIEKKNGTLIYKAVPRKKLMDYLQIEVETLEEDDDHFDAIMNNYSTFNIVCYYAFFKYDLEQLHKKKNSLHERRSTFSKIKEKYERDNDEHKKNLAETRIEEVEHEIEEVERKLEDGKKFLKELDEPLKKLKIDINSLSDSFGIENIKYWNEQVMGVIDSSHPNHDNWKILTEEERENEKKGWFHTLVINEILSPWFVDNLRFIDSSTNEICRIYNVENKDKLSVLLYSLIKNEPNSTYKTSQFVNKWLEVFKIGDSIEIESTEEGLGVKVYLCNNDKKHLLADEGYGITQLVSLLLQIDNKINKKSRIVWNEDIGAEQHETYYSRSYISVEEPEIHLHPKYQSLLAEMFVEAYQKYNIHFIIETHSEYLIRKLQVMVADKDNALTPNDVSLNYVEKNEDDVSHNRQIKLLEDGRLDGSFGEGFYDEAGGLSRQLFMLNE